MAASKEPKTGGKPPSPRAKVVKWLDELAKAGADMERAKSVLHKVRTDVNASKTDREHFYRALAQQSFAWYLGALRGRPMTGDEMKAFVQERVAAAKAKASPR